MSALLFWVGFFMIFSYLVSVNGWFNKGKGIKHSPNYDQVKHGGYLWLVIGLLSFLQSFYIDG